MSSPAFETRFLVLEKLKLSQDHSLILSRLRPCKRKSTTPPPPSPRTPPRYKNRDGQGNRCRDSSPPALIGSPYRIYMPVLRYLKAYFISLLYDFDSYYNFYNNYNILNGDLDKESVTYKTVHNCYKKYLRIVHEIIINVIKVKPFKPLEMPNLVHLLRLYLLLSC